MRFSSALTRAGVTAVGVALSASSARARPADPVLLHHYEHSYNAEGHTDAVDINVDLFSTADGNYKWQYTVHNNSFAGSEGLNGFSGFELALPRTVDDIGNITSPWDGQAEIDQFSGMPVEWDISNGPGIEPGQTGVFSFTTLPRQVTNSTGWFHSWQGSQTDIVNYTDTHGAVGPEAPDVTLPPVQAPEPASIALAGIGIAMLRLRAKRSRKSA